MKVLFIIDSLKSGGKERRLVSLLEGFYSYKDIDMELVILSDEIHYKSILKTNIKIHFLKRDLRKDLGLLSKFNKILNSFNPDLVHCWDNIAAIHFGPICKLRKIPFINSMITAAPETSKLSKRYLTNAISYPFSDVILSNSQAGLDRLFVPKRKQKVIYNGFNFERLTHLKERKKICNKLGIREGDFIVGMVASFNNHKDYKTFVKAGERILKKRKDIVFVAVGGGSNLEVVKKSIKKVNLKSFFFTGRQTDVESIVNIFDIGVLSTYSEGISNSIMEYMAMEKPVIVSKGGGTKELVIDKVTGFLIEPKNPLVLANKIKFLMDNKELALEFGKNGRKRIDKYFTVDRMISETYQLYNKTLHK